MTEIEQTIALGARFVTPVTLCAALGCGLVAGTFFAFSTFVMPALASLPSKQGILAMQAINVAVINRWFLGVFLGTGAACAVLAVSSLLARDQPGAWFRVGGAALYLLGTIAVTMTLNVPLNDLLAKIQPDAPDAATFWATYLGAWTRWNSARAAAALLAAASLTLSLLASASAPTPPT
jgi:uncharacterized membrane protein